jgi:hypothetical protein
MEADYMRHMNDVVDIRAREGMQKILRGPGVPEWSKASMKARA